MLARWLPGYRHSSSSSWQQREGEIPSAYRPHATDVFQTNTEALIRRAHTGDDMHWSNYGDVYRTH